VGGGLRVDEIVGRRLGEFEVQELIGQGSFGLVFRASQALLQREAVVKVARFMGTETQQQRAVSRFMAEARLASRIDHPFAAHVYAFGVEPDGLLWIAMEFVRGTPLNEILRGAEPMAIERAIPLIRRLCEVVHQAHEQGIVHRDLKPANVMVIARAGTLFPKLLDLGVARDVHAGGEERRGPLGTPVYMAPEQWVDARAVTAAADIYALGIVAYEILTGRPPFVADSLQAIAAQHATRAAPSLPVEFPAALSAAIERALAKRPAERFPTALAFGEALLETSGIATEGFNLPALDEVTRDEVLVHGPQPIAEAISALEASRSPAAARTALWQVARVMSKYVGLVALACRARTGSGRLGDAPAVLELLAAMRRGRLDAAQWWRLGRELCRPFAVTPELHPVPELVGLYFEGRAELRTSMDALLESRASEPLEDASPDALRGFLLGAVPALGSSLRALRFLHDYRLVVPLEGRDELWMGVRRPVRHATHVTRPRSLRGSMEGTFAGGGASLGAPRAPDTLALGSGSATHLAVGAPDESPPRVTDTIAAVASHAADGSATRPLLVGADGVVVATLWPLFQVEPPSPGYPPELFMLDGQGRRGARLLSASERLERNDEGVWATLGLGSLDAELSGGLADDDTPPYRGLATFTESDAGLFFGREREVEGFVNRLATMPLIAVVGPSGAGKSSFVQAGVLPGLGPAWSSIVVRPGPTPIAALCARLESRGIALAPAHVLADPATVGVALRQHALGSGTSLLLVVDQFEELVTVCLDEREQRAYSEALVAAGDQDDPVRVVLTMRDDFMVRVAQLPALRHRLATCLQILTTPVAADLLRILTEPARRAGYSFEDDALPDEMVAEVASQPAALALLSFTAYQLWQFRDRHFKQLPRKAYRSLGGVGGALAQHAEATLAAMDERARAVVREVFRHLVTAEGTRAVLSRAELLQVAGGASAESALEALITARLLVSMDRGDGESIEVVHEALLSAWPRLVAWRQEDAEHARLRDQLRVAARQWADRRRPRGLLWRGEALAEFEVWRRRYRGALTDVEEAFSQASIDDAARGRRLRRGALIIVGTGLVVALVVFARLRSQAEGARVQAVASKARAEASERQAAVQLTESYAEQGRRTLLAGDPQSALLYLDAALERGRDTAALRYMVQRGLDALGRGVKTLAGHRGAVWDARYSPDGTRLASIGADGDARIWDIATGKTLHTLTGHVVALAPQVAWSPDGHVLLTGDGAGTIRVWDPNTGTLVRSIEAHAGAVIELYVHPRGQSILSSGLDGDVALWSLVDGAEIARLETPSVEAFARAAFDARGERVIITYNVDEGPGFARLWEPASRRTFDLRAHTDTLWFPRFSPDGAHVATCSSDRTVRIWSTSDGRLERVLAGHDEAVGDVAWSADGSLLATGSTDHSIKLWDTTTGAVKHGLRGHTAKINRLEFGPRGELVSISADGTARVWDVRRGVLLATYAHGGFLYQLSLRADGAELATASLSGAVKVWSLRERALQRTVEPAARPPAPGTWVLEPGGASVVRADADGVARWDLATGQVTRLARDVASTPLAVAPDGSAVAYGIGADVVVVLDAAGRRAMAVGTGAIEAVTFVGARALVAASPAGGLVRIDVQTGAVTARDRGDGVGALYPIPPGRSLLAGVRDSTEAFGTIWELDGATLARRRQLATDITDLRPSPDGRHVLLIGHHSITPLWDLAAGASVPPRLLDQGAVPMAFAWSPDSTRLFVAQSDGTLNAWSATDGSRLRSIQAHELWVSSIATSSDGAVIFTTGGDASVRAWDAVELRQLDGFVAAAGVTSTQPALDGRALVTMGPDAIDIWRSGRFEGSRAELAAELACRLPNQLVDGMIVPRLAAPGCP
jgi:WD40 repeat protein/tRNA A-37 threonylcarbamoyl transferase component Bud32